MTFKKYMLEHKDKCSYICDFDIFNNLDIREGAILSAIIDLDDFKNVEGNGMLITPSYIQIKRPSGKTKTIKLGLKTLVELNYLILNKDENHGRGNYYKLNYDKLYACLNSQCDIPNNQCDIPNGQSHILNSQSDFLNGQHSITYQEHYQKPININIEKTEETRHKYGNYKHILLTDEDINKFKTEYPNDFNRYIDEMDSGIEAKGNSPYRNYLAALRNGAKNDYKKPKSTFKKDDTYLHPEKQVKIVQEDTSNRHYL